MNFEQESICMQNVSPVLNQFDYLFLIIGIIGLIYLIIDDKKVHYIGVGIDLRALFWKIMLLIVPILSFASFFILHFDI